VELIDFVTSATGFVILETAVPIGLFVVCDPADALLPGCGLGAPSEVLTTLSRGLGLKVLGCGSFGGCMPTFVTLMPANGFLLDCKDAELGSAVAGVLVGTRAESSGAAPAGGWPAAGAGLDRAFIASRAEPIPAPLDAAGLPSMVAGTSRPKNPPPGEPNSRGIVGLVPAVGLLGGGVGVG
jgi:hypothetical protein